MWCGWIRERDEYALLVVRLDGKTGDRSRCGEATRLSVADIEGGSVQRADNVKAFEPTPIQRDLAVGAAIFDAVDLSIDFASE